MIQNFWLRLKSHEKRMTGRVKKLSEIETFGSLLILLISVSVFWVFAWNAHVIGPWVDNLLGLPPSGLDSSAKIRWRRMWSTTLCVTNIVLFIIVYCLKLYDRRRERVSSSATSEKEPKKGQQQRERGISNAQKLTKQDLDDAVEEGQGEKP